MTKPKTNVHKSTNIVWQEGDIDRSAREYRNMHPGAIIWLTGLSGAGKTTIAVELERRLFLSSVRAYRLDGDNVRFGLCSNLGFSPEDREENIRRIGEVAKLLADAGIICITSFISPYRAHRQNIRESVARKEDFIEVFVKCPVEVCEQRDAKGLYKKARAGEIKEFTGISAPYEAPDNPEIVIDTSKQTIEESVQAIFDFLEANGYLGATATNILKGAQA